MNIFKTLGKAIYRGIETHQKAQVLRVLQQMSDRQLEDIGISRAELQRGVKAYPWHTATTEATAPQTAAVLSFKPATATSQTTFHINGQQPKLAA
ncbi:MAG: DUF1127 domain-containing protein [Thiolinea sp.]